MHRKSYLAIACCILSPPHRRCMRRRRNAPRRSIRCAIRKFSTMVARLDLEKYKATIKGLTQFGDRRQGTARNRAAVDWIEAQLKSYGCTNTERIIYTYTTPQRTAADAAPAPAATRPAAGRARAARAALVDVLGRGRSDWASGRRAHRGVRTRTGVNTDSLKQPDPKLRALNAEPAVDGERQEVYCTKIGTTHPEEMYIVGGHMDGTAGAKPRTTTARARRS